MYLLQKIARGIDRWLASPHRALLTWALLDLLASFLFVVLFFNGAFNKFYPRWSEFLASVLPFPLPGSLKETAAAAVFAFVFSWYRPLILRLGLWRWIAWIAIASGFAMGAPLVTPMAPASLVLQGLLFGVAFGLPFLLIAGRRTPFTRAVLALGVFWAGWLFASLASGHEGSASHVLLPLANLVAAAILLYGTKPIVPGTSSGSGESPSGGEGTASVPRDTASLGGES